MILSLLHLVGLRPRVYYTLANFRGEGGKAPLPHSQYANDVMYNVRQPLAAIDVIKIFFYIKN